jgi:hypothetical protein
MKTRNIEMYIGEGSDFGTWGTEYVEIPWDTPIDKIEEVAIKTLKNCELSDDFQFCGVYSIPELDDSINQYYYYEIHVIGKNGFSTCLVTKNEYDIDIDSDSILEEAIENKLIDSDDYQYCDYIEELDEKEYEEMFGSLK